MQTKSSTLQENNLLSLFYLQSVIRVSLFFSCCWRQNMKNDVFCATHLAFFVPLALFDSFFFWNTWLVDGIFSIFDVVQILLLSVACGTVCNARNKIKKNSLALTRPYSQS